MTSNIVLTNLIHKNFSTVFLDLICQEPFSNIYKSLNYYFSNVMKMMSKIMNLSERLRVRRSAIKLCGIKMIMYIYYITQLLWCSMHNSTYHEQGRTCLNDYMHHTLYTIKGALVYFHKFYYETTKVLLSTYYLLFFRTEI